MTTNDLIRELAELLGIDAEQIEVDYKDGKLFVTCAGVDPEDFDDDDGEFEDGDD